MEPSRIYTDTSVFGGCFDTEFQEESLRFFSLARRGRIVLLLSDVVIRELRRAPAHLHELLESLPPAAISEVELTAAVFELRNAYLEARVVSRRSLDDATHVAAATLARADAIVSWNFKHIVSLGRIRGYNRINEQMGYGALTILSPQGVTFDDEG